MRDSRLDFKMHTQNSFQVASISDISRDQNGTFSKFDLKKHLYGARGPAFHVSDGIFSFYTVFVYT